jgi:hypothetical protein
MQFDRRAALTFLAGAALAPMGAPGAAARSARREFAVLRGGTDIGRHSIALSRDGADLRVEVDVELVVRVLGIAAYRYEMTNRELWRGGVLVSGESVVNDDGRRKRVVSRREGDALMVESPDFTGRAPGDVATTTYFTPAFIDRAPWLSTDSGELLRVRASRSGAVTVETGDGPVQATRWRVTDGGEFDVLLDYDGRGEWISVSFDGRGERVVYRPDSVGPAFGPLWQG